MRTQQLLSTLLIGLVPNIFSFLFSIDSSPPILLTLVLTTPLSFANKLHRRERASSIWVHGALRNSGVFVRMRNRGPNHGPTTRDGPGGQEKNRKIFMDLGNILMSICQLVCKGSFFY